jgi:hypothetical protein
MVRYLRDLIADDEGALEVLEGLSAETCEGIEVLVEMTARPWLDLEDSGLGHLGRASSCPAGRLPASSRDQEQSTTSVRLVMDRRMEEVLGAIGSHLSGSTLARW